LVLRKIQARTSNDAWSNRQPFHFGFLSFKIGSCKVFQAKIIARKMPEKVLRGFAWNDNLDERIRWPAERSDFFESEKAFKDFRIGRKKGISPFQSPAR
jgi:hypothetical protein